MQVVYTGFGIILYAAVMLLRFYRCQDFTKSQVRKSKRKIFIRGLSKQYGFASQEFLVVRGNGWGFMWSLSAHLPLEGGGGVSF